MSAIRVLLADDHTIVRKGLRSLLDAETDIQVLGEAEDGRAAVQLAEQICPDVVVMDISMPLLNGLEATRMIRERCPKTRVVVLTMHTNEEYILQVFRAGASGYVVKRAAPAELVLAIRAANQGQTFLSPSISAEVIEGYLFLASAQAEGGYAKLSSREREVLQLIAEGRTSREIAAILHVGAKTVESHRANLAAKLDIHTTAELVRYAIRKGLVSLDE